MKIRSVQFSFLVTVICAILAIAIFVGGLCIYEVDSYIQQQAKDLIDITCSNEALQINDVFGDMKKSVKIMESYVLSFFKSEADVTDRAKQAEVIQYVDEMFAEVAKNTDGAIAYYLRYDPAISDSTAGVFYSKTNGSEEYLRFPPTDISMYSKDDTEHVGWFWQPYEAGKPVWMHPYYNQNNSVLMISYVVPLYCEDIFIGVVGMDFDYTVLTDRVQQIKIYKNGFARLEIDGAVIHNGPDAPADKPASEMGEDYLTVSEELTNGMSIVLFASFDDIRQIRHEIVFKILLSVLLLASIFSLIVFFMVKKIVRPLKKLTDASIKLSKGDYDVEIAHSETYEIKLLNTAFENMIMNLKEHKRLQHLLAYRDPMTGLRNTTSYKEWVADFDKKIQAEEVSFGVAVLDMNCLKQANDTYGHIAGNNMIRAASQIISDTFKRSPVFRIGGDEFLVILQKRDLEERERLFAKFDAECANTVVDVDSVSLPLSIAKGFSLFDPTHDTQFSDVFHRADDEMYKNKEAMKKRSI